jgi:hypothetical protein
VLPAPASKLDQAAIRRVLIESIVNVISVVVITDVVTHQPAEMLFIQRDDVVEDLAATTTHPAFATRFAKAPTSIRFPSTRRGLEGGNSTESTTPYNRFAGASLSAAF